MDLATNKTVRGEIEFCEKLPKTLQYLSLRDNFVDDPHFLDHCQMLTNLSVMDVSYQNQYDSYQEVFKREVNISEEQSDFDTWLKLNKTEMNETYVNSLPAITLKITFDSIFC